MNTRVSLKSVVVLATLLVALAPAICQAQKGKKPGGGGGGNDGGGGEPAETYVFAPLDLGSLVNDINDLREIVGFMSMPSNQYAAAYWTVSESNGQVETNLAILSGGIEAYSINNLGEIVGVGFGSAGNYVAVYWPSPSSTAEPLPSLPGYDVSVAQGINNDGLICGYVSKSALDASGQPIPATYDSPSNRAVVWRVDSSGETPIINGPFELPTSGDGVENAAIAVNDNDENGIAQVVGRGGFLWDVLSHEDGTVSVSSTPLDVGVPTGINNAGLISGRLTGTREVDALVWSRDSTWFLNRGRGRNKMPYAGAWDINDSGLIVGETCTDTSLGAIGRACFWNGIDGSLTYLDGYLPANPSIADLYSARAVNAFGDIVGSGSSNFVAVRVTQ